MKVTKRIPFDVNRISEGKVVDLGGNPVRIISTDRKSADNNFPVIGLCPWGSDGTETIETFTIDGYHTLGDKHYGRSPRLFIEIEEEVEPKFEPFQKVLVRDIDPQPWRAAFFSHIRPKEAHSAYTYETIGSGCYKQCIPYEGNEALWNTTNSPK